VEPNSAKATINQRIRKARSQLSTVYGADRHTLKRSINRIKHLKPGPGHQITLENRLKNLEQAIETSAKQRIWRKHHRPVSVYPETNLPILEKRDEIVAAIEKYRAIIISGETGSGKTTQIPKFCLDAGQGLDGVIGCTQPRRIAATTVARRVAEELNQSLGEMVGYKIRFRDKTSPDGFIKIMTDGILLAEIQTDPFLNCYDTLIIDEAHERSLNIDLALGIIKQLLSKRRHLKLIVTSATIDTQKFSRAFNDAPIIEVSGRMYPVQVRYQAPATMADGMDSSPVDMAIDAVERLGRESPKGDILVFMPTEQDIRDTCRLLEGRYGEHTKILPLFARLAGQKQSRVFARVSGRKIIVATNIAETSITIPGIKYVVDTGLARIPRYTPRSRCTLLPIDSISRSSADQRKGRCGRVADGVCVRLYSEEDYLSRSLFTPPEILRSNLADVILRMIALKLGDVADFPFIDPPPTKSIQDGYNLLLELGAISPTPKRKKDHLRYRLTADGKLMAWLPIDPRLSRMLIEARRRGCLAEIVIIAAILSIQDPRERPHEVQKEADKVHAAWVDPESDFVTLLNIWRRFELEISMGKGLRKIKRFCRDHFLSYRRMREWKDIHHQLRIVLKESGIRVGSLPEAGIFANGPSGEFSPRYTSVHQSILSGFLSNIACKKEKNIYSAAKGREVMIFPGSGLFNRAGKWIVAAEMVLTSRLFARTVAHIDPGWLESLAKDRCRYTYANPRWDRKRETVMASEQVSLFGLVIVPRRNVVYGRIDREKASVIFIENALVEGDLQQPFPFVLHNQGLIEQVLDMENRLRRRDLFIGYDALAAFYHQRLDGVWNVRLLRQKIKATGDDGFLRMQKEDLLRYPPKEMELAGFPNSIQLGEGIYSCSYTYEPGGSADGVSVSIPASAAASVPIGALDWLVPGLIGEKIKALVKGLPKTYRRRLGAIPQVLEVITREMPKPAHTDPLINILGQFFHLRFGVHIPATKWPMDSLPDYLKMRLVLTDTKGREIQSSQNPIVLRRIIPSNIDPEILNTHKKCWEQSGITRWDFGDVPKVLELSEAGGPGLIAYPALTVEVDNPGQVSLRLYQYWNRAVRAHIMGVKTLATLHLSKEMKFLKRVFKIPGVAVSKTSFFGGAAEVERQLFDKITTILFAKNIRTEKAFYACLNAAQPQLHQTAQSLLAVVEPVLNAYHGVRTQLAELQTRHVANRSIMRFIDRRLNDLNRLIPKEFIGLYDLDRLDRLPLFISAINVRTQRAVIDLEKDRRKAEKVRSFSEHLEALLATLSPATSEAKRRTLEAYFWRLEAYKVSVFAQELRISQPVSAKALKEKLAEIERMV